MPEVRESPVGAGLVNLTALGTGALVLTSGAATAFPDAFGAAHAAFSCGLFAIGTVGLLWAYALGVGRSRTDDVNLGGLFFLAAPAAPHRERRLFRLALAVEIVVVVAAAAMHPFSVVAFGVLAPMFALGLMGMWGGRHASFPPRPAKRAA